MQNETPTHVTETEKPTPQKKRWFRIVLWIFAGLFLTVLLLRLLIASPIGRGIIEDQLEGRIIAGQQIQIDGFEGDVLGRFKIAKLSIQDTDGEWLNAQNAELKWKPLKLIGKTLYLNSIGIGSIDVSRKPLLPASPEKDDDETPSSIFIKRFVLEEADIPKVSIAQETGLPETRHSLNLSADIGSTQSYLKLATSTAGLNDDGSLIRQDEETINIDLNWSLKKLLNGHVDIKIPQNGFVSTFLPAPLEDDLTLLFSGKGDLKNWESLGNLSLGPKTIASLDGKSTASVAKFNIIADLEGFALANPATDRLGSTLNLDLDANLTSLRKAELTAHFVSRVLEISTSGPVNLRKPEMLDIWTLKADILSLTQLSQMPDLKAKSAKFDGVWQYGDTQSKLAGKLIADQFAYSGRTIQSAEINLDSQLADDTLKFKIDTATNKLRTQIAALDDALGAKLTSNIRGQLDIASQNLNLDQFELKAAQFDTSGKGNLSTEGKSSFKLNSNLKNVSHFTDALNGAIQFNTTLDRAGPSAPFKLSLKSKNSEITSSNENIQAFLDGPVNLDVAASMLASGPITFDANIDSGANMALVRGSMENEQLITKLVANIPALNLQSVQARNAVLALDLNGPLTNLTEDLSFTASSIAANGLDIADLSLTSNGQIQDGGILTDIQIEASANDRPLKGTSQISYDNGLEIKTLQANWADLNLNANASLSDQAPLNATIDLKGTLAALGLDGAIDVQGNLTGETLQLSAKATDLVFGDTLLPVTTINASGKPNAFDFDVKTNGFMTLVAPDTPVEIVIRGNATQVEESRNITFSLDGKMDEESFSSVEPVKITQSADLLSIDAKLDSLGGIINLSGSKTQTDTGLKLAIETLSLSRINALFGREGLTGSLDANADWSAQDTTGSGTYNLELKDAGREGDAIAFINASIDGEFIEERLVSVFEAHNGGDLNVDAVFSVPMQVENGIPNLNQNDVARLDIGALGKLEAAWALVGLDSVALNGFFELNAEAEAPLLELRPVGQATISDTDFEHDRYGARMSNIEALVNFDTKSIELESATATGVDGGTVSGSGKMFLSPETPSAMHIDFDNFGAIKQDGLAANFTGRLDVTRAIEGIKIAGDLNIDQAKVNIAQFGSSGVKTIDVIFLDEIDDLENQEPEVSPTSKMALDMKVTADRRVYVTGRGLNIELSADTRIKGTLKTPDVRGTANIVRGEFSLLGQPFAFSEGVVRLDGNPAEATTDMQARRTSDGVTSIINVSGSVRSPTISFSSSPDLPEDEIISRLLFGRAPTQLSAVEAAQLAVAAANMTGNGEGFSPLSSIQNAIGLDRLVVSQDADSNPQLETGKYLSENVYVELRSRASGQSDLAIEWEPVENVEVGTVFGNENGAKVSVEWKKELD
ncbi:translocation/assembly module TamB domain-containing protein [Hirschia baltica]|uniref:Translocation and assembly module TamB C-terminal domain-containing protein n=1 Tax=Hirschia baltica (strain ATCC 49814 / DSM 5838 / IFAM 1418) TaxID=582402 RepID=C6XPH5_HIRBI|nr:translocation/assembly module TamB domain-containing protein [Hirschia baltica]ACT58461.1 protein of unknown function DUF490 [Hirschia baltica ATCC 49814]